MLSNFWPCEQPTDAEWDVRWRNLRRELETGNVLIGDVVNGRFQTINCVLTHVEPFLTILLFSRSVQVLSIRFNSKFSTLITIASVRNGKTRGSSAQRTFSDSRLLLPPVVKFSCGIFLISKGFRLSWWVCYQSAIVGKTCCLNLTVPFFFCRGDCWPSRTPFIIAFRPTFLIKNGNSYTIVLRKKSGSHILYIPKRFSRNGIYSEKWTLSSIFLPTSAWGTSQPSQLESSNSKPILTTAKWTNLWENGSKGTFYKLPARYEFNS